MVGESPTLHFAKLKHPTKPKPPKTGNPDPHYFELHASGMTGIAPVHLRCTLRWVFTAPHQINRLLTTQKRTYALCTGCVRFVYAKNRPKIPRFNLPR